MWRHGLQAVSYTHLDVYKRQAVHSLRAQADKANYSKTMRKVLEDQENLEIKQMEVTEILAEDGADGKKIITGVRTYSGATYLSLIHI